MTGCSHQIVVSYTRTVRITARIDRRRSFWTGPRRAGCWATTRGSGTCARCSSTQRHTSAVLLGKCHDAADVARLQAGTPDGGVFRPAVKNRFVPRLIAFIYGGSFPMLVCERGRGSSSGKWSRIGTYRPHYLSWWGLVFWSTRACRFFVSVGGPGDRRAVKIWYVPSAGLSC